MWVQPVVHIDVDLQPEENWYCLNTFCYGSDCRAVLFNLIKNSQALIKILKFSNVLDLAIVAIVDTWLEYNL